MKKLAITILGILCFILLSGCGGSSSPSSQAKKDTVTIALSADVSTLDMHKAMGTQTAAVCFNIYDALTRIDPDGKVQCLLAESYKSLDDYTWQFKLKPNVKFTNGEPFDAKVVKFNIERVLNKNYGSLLRGDFSNIESATVVDNLTVNIKTKKANPTLPLRISYLGMVPPKYTKEVGDKTFGEKPIGTGPYKVQSWEKGSKITLVANDNYFKGKPSIKNVIFKIVPEESTRVMALQSGELDVAMSIPSSQTDVIKKSQNNTVTAGPANRTIYLGMNTINNEALKDIKVRRAINYAIDKESIIKNILGGYGKSTVALTLPQWEGYDANVNGYEFNKEKAKSLLKEAGHVNDLTLEIGVTPGEYPSFKEVADAIASMLTDVGIKANVKTYEKGILRKEVTSHNIQGLYLLGFGGAYAENNQTLRIILCSGERYSCYAQPSFDQLFVAAGSTMDKDKRVKMWSDVQKDIVTNAPVVSLYQLYGIYGINKQLDWKPRLDEIILASEMKFK